MKNGGEIMTINLTAEQLVTLQLRIMSALSFYQQRPEKEAKRMAELLTLAGAAASELQERRKADETRNIDDGLNGQLSRLATHSAEESAQMAKWDRPTPKSDLRLQAEKIADDVQELIKRLPDADQGAHDRPERRIDKHIDAPNNGERHCRR